MTTQTHGGRGGPALICWFVVIASASWAKAEKPAVELPETTVEAAPFDPIEHTTGTAQSVDPAPWQGAGMTAADMLETVPGLTLRRLGGPGSPTTLSIRGLGADHIGVFLDDLPLGSATLGAVDLNLFALEDIERIEVHRGSTPNRFAGPMGGLVRLVTRAPPKDGWRHGAHLGMGSQLARSAHASSGGPVGPALLQLHAAYQGTAGNFLFYDDQETLYNPNDDVLRRRQNNRSDQGVLRLRTFIGDPEKSHWQIKAHGAVRETGVPGPGAAQTDATRAGEHEANVRLMYVHGVAAFAPIEWQTGVDALWGRRRFADPHGEVGLAVLQAQSSVVQAGWDLHAQWWITPSLALSASPRVDTQNYTQDNTGGLSLRTTELSHRRARWLMPIAAQWSLGSQFRIEPQVRLEDTFQSSDLASALERTSQVSPRLGLFWEPHPICMLRTSAGRIHRFPSLLELYGDGAITLAQTNLQPEIGWSSDVGAECQPAVPMGGTTRLLLAGFHNRMQNQIALLASSPMTFRAQNLGSTEVWGIEASAHASWPWLALIAHYTFSHGRDRSELLGIAGNALVGLPAHRFFATVAAGPPWLSARYTLNANGQFYLDRANLRPVPPRYRHDLLIQAKLWQTGLEAKVVVANITNQLAEYVDLPGGARGVSKVADHIGYPLPGRTFFASLLWSWP